MAEGIAILVQMEGERGEAEMGGILWGRGRRVLNIHFGG